MWRLWRSQWSHGLVHNWQLTVRRMHPTEWTPGPACSPCRTSTRWGCQRSYLHAPPDYLRLHGRYSKMLYLLHTKVHNKQDWSIFIALILKEEVLKWRLLLNKFCIRNFFLQKYLLECYYHIDMWQVSLQLGYLAVFIYRYPLFEGVADLTTVIPIIYAASY